MRITGGDFCGRKVMVAEEHVRPASDRVREAVFSMLVEVVPGCRAVDLFAGSGAYGLEAMSRGAEKVFWVEKNPSVLSVLKGNITSLCGKEATANVIQYNVWDWLERGGAHAVNGINLIFADPPYDRDGRKNQLGDLLQLLENNEMLADRVILLYEQDWREPVISQHEQWQLLRNKKYGKSRILIYKKKTRV